MGLRVAILGMGRWGQAWAKVLNSAPQTHVVATAGGRPPTASGPTHHSDYREALDHPGLEAVVVTLPVALHLDAVRQATSRGLHVLCEKPAVPSRAELSELRQIARDADVAVRIDQNYRERLWVAAARRAISRIEPVSQIDIEFAQRELPIGGRERMAHPLIADMAIHHFDLLRHLTGREGRVVAATANRPAWSLYPGASDVVCLMELDDGGSVSYSGTWSARGRCTPWDGNWRFRGGGGSIDIRGLKIFTDAGYGSAAEPAGTEVDEDADLARVWATFRSAVAGDREAGTTVEDHARSLLLVLDAARAAGAAEPFSAPDGSSATAMTRSQGG